MSKSLFQIKEAKKSIYYMILKNANYSVVKEIRLMVLGGLGCIWIGTTGKDYRRA